MPLPHPYTRKEAEAWVGPPVQQGPCGVLRHLRRRGSHWRNRPQHTEGRLTTLRRARLLSGQAVLGTRHHDRRRKGGDDLWLRDAQPHPHTRTGQEVQRRLLPGVGESRLSARGDTPPSRANAGSFRGPSDVRHVARGLARALSESLRDARRSTWNFLLRSHCFRPRVHGIRNRRARFLRYPDPRRCRGAALV